MTDRPAFGPRINQLRGPEKNTAQVMLAAYRSAESLSRGSVKDRSAYWSRKARERAAELDRFLTRLGA